MDPQEAGYTYADETNFEVICGCQLSPLIHNNKLYVPVQSSTSGNDTLKSYDLVNGQESSQEVKKLISFAACKMFYLKNISLSVKSSNATKLGLYQLDTKTSPASWKIISRHSVPLLDVKNSIPIPYKDDGIIVVSILNQPSTSHIKFHIFSQSIAAEKPKSASSQIRYNANYQIQSCSILSNYIYCALSLPEGNIYIYKLDIASLRKETHDDENISPNCQWSIKISKLQNCFVSVFKGEIFIISIYKANNKSIVEIKRLLNHPEVSSVEHKLEFTHEVKVVTASIISGAQNPLIVIMYHDDKISKCYIKRASISLA